VKCVQTNGAAASGPGDGSSGDEHPDSTHKKVKVSKTSVEYVAVLLRWKNTHKSVRKLK